MPEQLILTDHFLIAMPALHDPNFFHSVTYICEHNADGAMGITINRPLDIALGEILRQTETPCEDDAINNATIFLGGPVQNERGFVIHRPHGEWDASLMVSDEICVTSSKDILEAIAAGKAPQDCLVALGYAGWSEGQLEHEIAENAWISVPAAGNIIFNTPYNQCWEAAAAQAGIDLNRLSNDIGHA
ncbi:MAG: YqgE/AlgH family protein [Thiotrichaceae bacterium]|nr:YqgE/AlgH family protein [Thiotrichaceae bacterium]